VAPATGAVLADLAARLAATSRDVPRGTDGLVHGACKPSQFLLRDRDAVLLDLDSAGRADPAGDVGTFLATLRQHAVRRDLARRSAETIPAAREALAQVFVRAYTEAMSSGPDDDLAIRISWYEAVALERKALRCFARAPRSPLTRALVAAGHACLDELEGRR